MKQIISRKNKRLILVTNDDGISSKGLRYLIELIKEYGDIYVVAPELPNSGKSHSVTINYPLRYSVISEQEGYCEYCCSGTPVDSVKLAFDRILPRKPDFVISGINHGSNSSINLIYSGTMGAVIEAAMCNIPGVGFSLLNYSKDADFSHCDVYIKKILEEFFKNGLSEYTCLNVNIPASNIKGIKVCRQARGMWVERFEERIDPHNEKYYWMRGEFVNLDKGTDSDEYALSNNYISTVPIQLDMTNYKMLKNIEQWDLKI